MTLPLPAAEAWLANPCAMRCISLACRACGLLSPPVPLCTYRFTLNPAISNTSKLIMTSSTGLRSIFVVFVSSAISYSSSPVVSHSASVRQPAFLILGHQQALRGSLLANAHPLPRMTLVRISQTSPGRPQHPRSRHPKENASFQVSHQ